MASPKIVKTHQITVILILTKKKWEKSRSKHRFPYDFGI